MQKQSNYKPIVPAVEQSSLILQCLGKGDNFQKTLKEIYADVGLHKSKAFTILNTLIKYDLVEKNELGKTYTLGPGLISLSRYYLDNLNYPAIVTPFISDLAREANGTALFAIISGDYLFVVAKFEGNQNVGLTIRLGHKFHLTLGAHGKSIVAFMLESKREKLLERKRLYFHGEPLNLDMNRLKTELDECRKNGYAIDRGEITPGINIVSSPVFGLNEEIAGCVILIGTFENSLFDKYGESTTYAARQISYKLGADLKNIAGLTDNKR
jgi:DNA-binding IclR family transcriptional regulator